MNYIYTVDMQKAETYSKDEIDELFSQYVDNYGIKAIVTQHVTGTTMTLENYDSEADAVILFKNGFILNSPRDYIIEDDGTVTFLIDNEENSVFDACIFKDVKEIKTLIIPKLILGNTIDQSGTESVEVILDNIGDYPDNCIIYYSNTLENPIEGGESMNLSDLKQQAKHVIGYVTAAALTLFVCVSCPGYSNSDIGSITVPKLPAPQITINTETAGYSYLQLTNVSSYPSNAVVHYKDNSEETYTSVELMNFLDVAKGFITDMDEDRPTPYSVYMSCDGYISSEVTTYGEVKTISQPTLSLSRSGSRVNGTIGGTENYATYVYKVGSAPTSISDGTVITGGSFSFTNSSSLTVYVVGFADGYNPSEARSASVGSYTPTLATPTLSLSRSGTTIYGTVGNMVSGATYVYKIGSAPTSQSDGTTISSSGSFSLSRSSSATIYVRGYMSGYNPSAAASDYIGSYVAPTPSLTLNAAIMMYDYNILNVFVQKPDSTVTYTAKAVNSDNGKTTTKSLNSSNEYGEHFSMSEMGYVNGQRSDCMVTVTASKSGYKSATVSRRVRLGSDGAIVGIYPVN